MKKVFFFSMMAAVAMMASCGKGGPSENSAVNEAIAAAEKEAPLKESPVLGQLPSICAQLKAAQKSVKEAIKPLESENAKEASAKGDDLKAATEELNKIYAGKVAEEAKKLDGKSIKVNFDNEYFSDVKATLKAVKTETTFGSVAIELKMTLAKALPKSKYGGVAFLWNWKYMDAQDKEVRGGAGSVDNSDPAISLKEGEVWTYTIDAANVPSSIEAGSKFDHLYIGKPEP